MQLLKRKRALDLKIMKIKQIKVINGCSIRGTRFMFVG